MGLQSERRIDAGGQGEKRRRHSAAARNVAGFRLGFLDLARAILDQADQMVDHVGLVDGRAGR